MHGRVWSEGEGSSASPERSIIWHMHSAVIPADLDSFFKDGRKICVGTCALFKLSKTSQPFVGLIRWLALKKENNLQLGVNWLYRSSELKVGKNIWVDSAPNEVFYSFQTNEIPATSLLHPCKVAFLPRGVELPTGTSSFVCRRAYDTANKSLGWLTDQHYVNDQQEEVDQLLHKTRTEMHVTLQSGGRSPKQANGPTSTSQLKASDSGQNSGSSFPSQAKGKKRERGDHGADSFKRERSLRLDDVDSIQCQTERNVKSEIARITEKGGLVSLDGVEKLVQLMQPDKERKMDLVSRSMLATVMALTDKVDCLNRFVQLRGLPVLDEWLQDIHKGKIGDGNNRKDGDKSVEEFLLVLLRALDKLPVNLQALQMCNIGRSVNHLRSHKNTDIQRRARTLVDTWKKRVEAEMISIDAKSGSTQAVSAWPSKSRLPEASHGGSRTPSGSDVAIKIQNSTFKTASCRPSPGESGMKYDTSSPGLVKPASSLASGKEIQPRTSAGGILDAPQTKEDMSSSSNQSHNCSQSFSTKDDLKSCTSGSVSSNISSITTRNGKNSVFPGTSATGSRKEISSSKGSPAHKIIASEKSASSSIAGERVVEGPISGNPDKLIVKIPNHARSPAQCDSGGSLEDPTTMGIQTSSPALLNKLEQTDLALKDKNATSRSYVESDMNERKDNDPKDGSEGSDSPAVLHDEEQSMTIVDSERVTEGPPKNQLRSVNLHISSFSPMNALIESCVKHSEETSSLSLEDDVGMNLLASVAAGEISRSDVVSPTDSTERSIHQVEDVCTGDEAKSGSLPENYHTALQNRLHNDAECDDQKKAVPASCSADGKFEKSPSLEDISSGDGTKDFNSSGINLRSDIDTREVSEKSNEKIDTTSKAFPLSTENMREGELYVSKEVTFSNAIADSVSKCGIGGTDHLSIDECKPMIEVADAKPAGGLDLTTISQHKPTYTVADHENLDQKSVSQAGNAEEPNGCDTKIFMRKSESLDKEQEINVTGKSNGSAFPCSTSLGLNDNCKVASTDEQEIPGHILPRESQCPGSLVHETIKVELTGSKSDKIQAEDTRAVFSSVAGVTDPSSRMKFDLNKGLGADDGKCGELVTWTSSVHKINALPLSVNPIPSAHSASVTTASAANRQYVPPEDLLRSKVELGWKGSAANSAFRPAEPRKVVEITLDPSYSPFPDASTSKNSRCPLDIDLNVPVERVLEEMASRGSGLAVESTTDLASNCATLLNGASDSMPLRGSGGLDLDLNLADEANDTGHCFTSSNYHGAASLVHVKPPSNFHSHRDFDLNNGPSVDDWSAAGHFSINQPGKGVAPSRHPSAAGLAMNNPGLNSFSSWFPPGNTFSTTSVLPAQGEQPFPVIPPGAFQRAFGPAAGVTPFNPDVYCGSVLSSSPSVPFPSSPFQFSVFPFGTTFPLPSSSFSVGGTSYPDSSSGARPFVPSVNSQYLGPVGSIAPQFQRPYIVGLPDISNNGGWVSNRKWGRQGLDLNAGPLTMDSESKDEMVPLSSGQHSVASLQALAEEQTRKFSSSSGVLKRKEPEGGLENEPSRHKHSLWQ